MQKIWTVSQSQKSHFVVQEGKLLGHLVSADGIRIDRERVKAILKISLPRSKKDFFYWKNNFFALVHTKFC